LFSFYFFASSSKFPFLAGECLSLFFLLILAIYFLCLDAKKVTKKNQERKDIQHFSFICLDLTVALPWLQLLRPDVWFKVPKLLLLHPLFVVRKVPKNQGQSETVFTYLFFSVFGNRLKGDFRAFVRLTPHIPLRIMLITFKPDWRVQWLD